MRAAFHDIRELLMLCIRGTGGRLGIMLYVIVLAMQLAGIAVSVRQISWTADFYNALQKLDTAETLRQLAIFALIVITGAALFLTGDHLRKVLEMRWRRGLTETLLGQWLAPGMIWKVQHAQDRAPDNPDQRIAEDCAFFVEKLVSLSLLGIYSCVAVVSYFVVLWNLSTFPLAFSVFGIDISIPRYLVWLAPIYVAAAGTATHLLGAPLMRLKAQQQHKEGDFRFGLARLREHGEEVALWRGEAAEARLLSGRFDAIVANWRRLIRQELVIGLFTRPFSMTVLRTPLFLSLPGYLGGAITFGGLMQISMAFSNVVITLAWFIFRYRDIADLGAAIARLQGFRRRLTFAQGVAAELRHEMAEDDAIRIRDLTLRAPDGAVLLDIPDLEISAGSPVWVRGASGLGKTTLMRAMAGLWPYGSGSITMPRGTCVYLPQRAYLPLSALDAAAAYPLPGPASQAGALLPRMGLGHMPPSEPPGSLSGGEMQRLMLLRLLVQRPAWAILDEATSALDEATEMDMLALLRRELPDTTFVLISHHAPRGLGPMRHLDLEPYRAPPSRAAA